MYKNKTLLITGGTGSFGKTVLKRFLTSEIKEIRVFSRDEKKQDDMRMEYPNNNIKYYIGDVRDFDSINEATLGVDFVFHAAALKQVPSCEFYPMEAFKTNVLGTENIIKASILNKVKKVVMLSTDKAVYPINAMGMSKAMAEKIILARARRLSDKSTIFCVTRYGNVMGSRGSVIPLFISQLKKNLPLTITDPNMTRFLMSLEDALDLVLFAFANAKQGDIFIQKAPASTVKNLSLALISLLNIKAQIITIGTRHGEKLYETLISREEMVKCENLGRFYRIPIDNRELNYKNYFSCGLTEIEGYSDYTSHNAKQLNINDLKNLLLNTNEVKDSLYV